MERIAHMSHMHSSSIFFSSWRCSDRRNKKTKRTKRIEKFGGREKKREKCQLEERSKFEIRNSFDHHGRQILTFKLSDDDD